MSPLTSDEQRWLLGLARRAIRGALEDAPLDLEALKEEVPSEALRQPGAAFVTLRQGGELRGCLGVIQPRPPLYQAVANAAVLAAMQDPRFAPMRPAELATVEVEISVLSPFFALGAEEVIPGTHGVLVSQGFRRGLLLPQVVREYAWAREQFLEHACLKAGLPATAWKEGAALEGFTALVFSDVAVAAAPADSSPGRRF